MLLASDELEEESTEEVQNINVWVSKKPISDQDQ